MNQRQTKSAVEYSLPLPLSGFRILLAEIATGQKTTVDLNHLRKTAGPLSVSQLWTRIALLLDLLRVPEDRGLDIAEAFASVLEQASDLSAIPRSEFEAVVRRVRDEDSGDQDVLIRYERKVLNLLRRSDTGCIAKPTNSVTSERGLTPGRLFEAGRGRSLRQPAFEPMGVPHA